MGRLSQSVHISRLKPAYTCLLRPKKQRRLKGQVDQLQYENVMMERSDHQIVKETSSRRPKYNLRPRARVNYYPESDVSSVTPESSDSESGEEVVLFQNPELVEERRRVARAREVLW